MIQKAKLTLLQSDNEHPVTKQISLRSDGTIEKKSLAQNLSRGQYQIIDVTPEQFSGGVRDLQSSQALAYGIVKTGGLGNIITKKDQQNGYEFPGDITRSNDFFEYDTRHGVFLGDIDDAKMDVAELQNVVKNIDPDIVAAPAMYRPSTGSLIYNKDTEEEIIGVNGYRLYIFVDNARLIPDFGKALHDRFWLNGHGFYAISTAGTLLDRGPLDTSVWQPSRIDFCAGAVCVAPLEQRLPEPMLMNQDAPFLDVAACLHRIKLSDAEHAQLKKIKVEARKAKEVEALAVREIWAANRVQELVTNRSISSEIAHEVVNKAIEKRELSGEFEVQLQDGSIVTVDELLADAKKYHGKRCCDPLEPDYHGDNRVGYISIKAGDKPYIWTHAHGGKRYSLKRTRKTIIAVAGQTTFTTDATVKIIAENPSYYNYGKNLVIVRSDSHADTRINIIDQHGLRDELGRDIQFQTVKVDAKQNVTYVNIDPPIPVCQFILARGAQRKLPPLKGIATAPYLRQDGSIVDKAGYDEATQLLLVLPDGIDASVPSHPTIEQVIDSVNYLWFPFKEFPFVDNVSRSVHFSNLLTASIRKSIPTAPGVAYDAPGAGTGKTLLELCVGQMTQNKTPRILTGVNSDDEMRKRITALLMEGCNLIILDNIVGHFVSPVLEAMLTAAYLSDRILGVSEMVDLPNTTMVMISGNNIQIVGDLNRRFLTCRIDAKIESPHTRKFDLDPLAYVKAHRLDMVRAALTIIRGYLTSGAGRIAAGRTASFEIWDDLVRQSLCWLATLPNCPLHLADPTLSIANNYADDTDTGTMKQILYHWFELFGSTFKTSGQIIADLFGLTSTIPNTIIVQDHKKLLQDALTAAIVTKNTGQPIDSKGLGNYLNRMNGRKLGGFVLEKGDLTNGSRLWHVLSDANLTSITSGVDGIENAIPTPPAMGQQELPTYQSFDPNIMTRLNTQQMDINVAPTTTNLKGTDRPRTFNDVLEHHRRQLEMEGKIDQ